MSAQDNLSPDQFMSVNELGKMPSQWNEGFDEDKWHVTGRALTNEEAFNNPSDRLGPRADDRARNFGFNTGAEFQDNLTDNVRQNGMETPIAVSQYQNGSVIQNGHHRWVAARTLGWDKVPVKIYPNGREPQ
jgi:ParB-like nuclease family protein